MLEHLSVHWEEGKKHNVTSKIPKQIMVTSSLGRHKGSIQSKNTLVVTGGHGGTFLKYSLCLLDFVDDQRMVIDAY